MSPLHLIELMTVALLVWFLYRGHKARIDDASCERALSGKGIDVASVSKRIHQVREDYLAVVGTRANDGSRQRRLHAAARCRLKRLTYFQNASAEGEDSLHQADARTN